MGRAVIGSGPSSPANSSSISLSGSRNHDRSLPTQSKPVADFIRKGLNAELGEWDIAIVGKSDRGGNVTVDPDLGVVCQERTVGKESKGKDFVLVGEKNRVSSRGVERIGNP